MLLCPKAIIAKIQDDRTASVDMTAWECIEFLKVRDSKRGTSAKLTSYTEAITQYLGSYTLPLLGSSTSMLQESQETVDVFWPMELRNGYLKTQNDLKTSYCVILAQFLQI